MKTNGLTVVRYLFAASLILVLFIFFGCSEKSAPTAAENPIATLSKNNVVHHVSVGGADICEALGLPTGCDANFSLAANMKADGSVSGQWQDTFTGGGEGYHIAVDCINVLGNAAIIGGVVTHGTVNGVDVSGRRAVTAVVDNGTSVNDPADQISFSFIDPGATFFFGTTDCNELTLQDFQNLPFQVLFDLTHGQVKVW